MARNRHAVIWTRISGQPKKMGDVILTEDEAAFTYTRAYLASGRPGFCLLGDGAIWGTDTVTYPIGERIPVFPRLLLGRRQGLPGVVRTPVSAPSRGNCLRQVARSGT